MHQAKQKGIKGRGEKKKEKGRGRHGLSEILDLTQEHSEKKLK